jgi:hypothetical protein
MWGLIVNGLMMRDTIAPFSGGFDGFEDILTRDMTRSTWKHAPNSSRPYVPIEPFGRQMTPKSKT